MKSSGRKGTKREAGRKRGDWGMSREAGLGRDKKTTQKEPSSEAKREKTEGAAVEVSSLIRMK